MPVFVFLHVLTVFVAIAMAYGPAALMVVASRSGDVRALRGITATSPGSPRPPTRARTTPCRPSSLRWSTRRATSCC